MFKEDILKGKKILVTVAEQVWVKKCQSIMLSMALI